MTPAPVNILPLRPRDHEDAARVAISWLAERHRKGWLNALSNLLDDWRPEGSEDGLQLDDDGMTMVSINANEWLIARGEIHARGGLRDINSYLLGTDGPYLTPGQKAWITQLRERPLRLYRVTDLRPGEGLTLVDELNPEAEPQAVHDRSSSLSAKLGMLMGTRIMRATDAAGEHLELSGAIYPFAKLRESQVLAQVREALAGAAALKLHAENLRDLAESEIARAWLAQWFEPALLPQILDASTGDPMLLVTDHYRVRDAAALAAALAAQPDVSGNAQQSWHRETRGSDDALRSLVAINPGREADRIEVFYRTQRLADAGRTWFEGLAGSAVQHLTRETTDPVSSVARAHEDGYAATPAAESPAPSMPPEVMAQVFEQFIHRHYAHWCDETIPALRGLTPRQAITTPAGLERVKGLLREYEEGERQQSAEQGRSAVSYQFLWDGLGIRR